MDYFKANLRSLGPLVLILQGLEYLNAGPCFGLASQVTHCVTSRNQCARSAVFYN